MTASRFVNKTKILENLYTLLISKNEEKLDIAIESTFRYPGNGDIEIWPSDHNSVEISIEDLIESLTGTDLNQKLCCFRQNIEGSHRKKLNVKNTSNTRLSQVYFKQDKT